MLYTPEILNRWVGQRLIGKKAAVTGRFRSGAPPLRSVK